MYEIFLHTKIRISIVKNTLLIFLIYLLISPVMGQANRDNWRLEKVINDFVGAYPFSLDNRFKLSVYSELKGRYSDSLKMVTLQFGDMGAMFFFANNCLLKANGNRAYSLDRFDENADKAFAMNQSMQRMFEGVMLLGNYGADEAMMEFVDEGLMRKNIQPFHKIYLRHILLKYGKFDPQNRRVVFYSDWLPENQYSYQDPRRGDIVKKPISPLKMVLDEHSIRGYYLDIGGEVYVHNVSRNVVYASAEDFNYNNITAFKLFVQKLFIESIQYIAQSEAVRIRDISQVSQVVMSSMGAESPDIPLPVEMTVSARPAPARAAAVSYRPAAGSSKVEPLYHEYSWIPMMLALLRHNRINIGDPDVIRYFVDQPYFSRIYDQLNLEERTRVDHYLSYR